MAINPTKTLNISDFLSQVRKNGFARLNKIAINIKPPQELVEILNYRDKDSYLTYYAESVIMPGQELLTTDLNFGGPTVTYPVKSEYRDITTSFLVDDDMRQKMFFDAWLNFVNPKENKYDFRYRDDYIGTIDIFQISEDGYRLSYGVRLYEVYPVEMGEIKGSWAEQEPVRLDVKFSYRYWRSLNADKYERSDDDAPEEFIGVDVVNNYKPKRGTEILESIDVVGRRRGTEVLESIDVTGKKKPTEILESIDVIGKRRGR